MGGEGLLRSRCRVEEIASRLAVQHLEELEPPRRLHIDDLRVREVCEEDKWRRIADAGWDPSTARKQIVAQGARLAGGPGQGVVGTFGASAARGPAPKDPVESCGWLHQEAAHRLGRCAPRPGSTVAWATPAWWARRQRGCPDSTPEPVVSRRRERLCTNPLASTTLSAARIPFANWQSSLSQKFLSLRFKESWRSAPSRSPCFSRRPRAGWPRQAHSPRPRLWPERARGGRSRVPQCPEQAGRSRRSTPVRAPGYRWRAELGPYRSNHESPLQTPARFHPRLASRLPTRAARALSPHRIPRTPPTAARGYQSHSPCHPALHPAAGW